MKKSLFTALIFLALLMQGFSQQNYLDTIMSGGFMRTFRVYIPAIYNAQTPRPLLFQFHGYGMNAEFFEGSGFKQVADTANFILITPNGTIDPVYPQFGQGWNTYTCCFPVDDVLFVSDLIDTLRQQYNIDTTRVFGAGFSNGGMMAYELGCRLSNRIAAAASVAGTMINSRLESCNPPRAVPVLEIHGTNDSALPWDGLITGIDTFMGIDIVMQHWVDLNECPLFPTITDLPNTDTTDGSTVTRYVWANCNDNSSVELFKVIGGGHAWPGHPYPNINQDIIAEQEIWRFFLKYKLTETTHTTDKPDFEQLSVYPNPASGYLTFENRSTADGCLTLVQTDGRIVAKLRLQGYGQQQVSVADVPQGLLLWKWVPGCEGAMQTGRVMVVRK